MNDFKADPLLVGLLDQLVDAVRDNDAEMIAIARENVLRYYAFEADARQRGRSALASLRSALNHALAEYQ